MDSLQKAVFNIRELIDQGQLEKAQRRLEKLMEYKPVLLDVINLKARLHMKRNESREFWACYEDNDQFDIIDPDVLDSFQIRQEACVKWQNPFWESYFEHGYRQMKNDIDPDEDTTRWLRQREGELKSREDALSANLGDLSALRELALEYVKCKRITESAILGSIEGRKTNGDFQNSIVFNQICGWRNVRLVHEFLNGEQDWPIVVYANPSETEPRLRLLGQALAHAGKTVYFFKSGNSPIPPGGEAQESAKSGKATIGRMPVVPGQSCINQEGGPDGLVEFLSKREREGLLLLASPLTFNRLWDADVFSKNFHCLTLNHFGNYSLRYAGLAFVGEYLDFVQPMYSFPVKKRLQAKSTIPISVVIPTRNSAYTLRQTLRSCLNQSFRKYEIVVSDNSSRGNEETRQLVEELADKRIRYLKPPYELPLAKHFEFACLQAEGEFVLPIGSDDAILFDALEALEEVLRHLPHDNVIQWDRLFYAWEDFMVVEQRGQFVIPRPYKKKNLDIGRYTSAAMLENVLFQSELTYGLPLLYLNSGYRKRFLPKLLEHTGRLWAGEAQDVYMGMASLLICESIPVLHYPITICGMCNSIGAKTFIDKGNHGGVSSRVAEDRGITVGAHIDTPLESQIPANPNDRSSLYRSFLRLRQFSANPMLDENKFSIPKVLEMLARTMKKDHVRFDLYRRLLEGAARKQENDFFHYFRSVVVPEITAKKHMAPELSSEKAKCYQEGFTNDGGLVLDAKKFGVTDVYQACELYRALTGI